MHLPAPASATASSVSIGLAMTDRQTQNRELTLDATECVLGLRCERENAACSEVQRPR